MKDPINIFWFRRDLRLDDNVGLFHALNSNNPVLPIFIFDPNILEHLPTTNARVTFIYNTLTNINYKLQKAGCCKIAMYHDTPINIFKQLATPYSIATVFTNHDYEPYAQERDTEVKDFLKSKGIAFKTFKDHVIYEKNEIVKHDGTPYLVYTPYMKSWKAKFKLQELKHYASKAIISNFILEPRPQHLSLADIGFKKSSQKVKDYILTPSLIKSYESTRNFPAKDATSKLGPHLRFGTVSIREVIRNAITEKNETFLQELIWREFFIQILWHFPHTQTKSFKPQYDRIVWRNNENEFKAWCEGKTGYPLVDAGMRQLNKTGFMHNRVRMLVGSFLCKHLLIDWRWGEAYFAEKLHDYEMASNIGNWQWVAGCGVDAAPYFRIFNPTTQIEKFDKNLEYIKQWVPDFQEDTYPKPIVDHKTARERCLSVYKKAINR
ncbi:cryptochrome/photolyase family protein [Snuella sedimenti]|uniref:Deoxyribodipyrimidine photo-lyase n=1 Tax=Snuella sedimenti TaxID=2798802 RepID=A0A8J7IFU9_9FLAO|nr:deoxyribodipyrimidine photo-lyase [Snuella sedimenti]MBJ6367068.1 deoxyribodipyrimidine photo-lyase [Snuella sedimenti]